MQISDRLLLLKALYRKHGWKAVIKQFRFSHARPVSRNWIEQFSPEGQGLEIGVGAQTIAPVKRTLLSDAYRSHTKDASLATVFFPAHEIPFPENTFQFILSEHVLEHVPNPIQVIKEWLRVLKPEGVVYLFMPHPERTFDQNRKLTSLAHLLEDENNQVGVMEDAHYEEWLEKVISPGLASHYQAQTKEECLSTCSLHRHVWTEATLSELLKFLSFEILFQQKTVSDRTDSFVVIAKKK